MLAKTVSPAFISQKILKCDKPRHQQCLVYKFECDLCDAGYVGYTSRHLHQRIEEDKGAISSIGQHFQKNISFVPLFPCSLVPLVPCYPVPLLPCYPVTLFPCSLVPLFPCCLVILFSCSLFLYFLSLFPCFPVPLFPSSFVSFLLCFPVPCSFVSLAFSLVFLFPCSLVPLFPFSPFSCSLFLCFLSLFPVFPVPLCCSLVYAQTRIGNLSVIYLIYRKTKNFFEPKICLNKVF